MRAVKLCSTEIISAKREIIKCGSDFSKQAIITLLIMPFADAGRFPGVVRAIIRRRRNRFISDYLFRELLIFRSGLSQTLLENNSLLESLISILPRKAFTRRIDPRHQFVDPVNRVVGDARRCVA